MRSLVVPAGANLTIRVDDAPSAVVIGDGRANHELEPPSRVSLGLADDPVRVAGPPLDFFAALGKLE
jgi:NAD+ kinase